MGTATPDIKVAPSPEVKAEKKAENITTKNSEAAKKLKTVAPTTAPAPNPEPSEEKPQWKLDKVGVTWGGDDKLNMTTLWPTLTSPDWETRITAGYTNSSERPDPNMNASSRDGLWISVSTTPWSITRGIKKLGNGIKNLFKKKK